MLPALEEWGLRVQWLLPALEEWAGLCNGCSFTITATQFSPSRELSPTYALLPPHNCH